MNRRILVGGCVAVLMVVGAVTASAGTKADARTCRTDWQTLHGSGGETFTSRGACTEFVRHGGQFQTTTLTYDWTIGRLDGTGFTPNQAVSYTILLGGSFIGSGGSYTDSNGAFTISFVPGLYCDLIFVVSDGVHQAQTSPITC